ncbi:MAG: hypothetical protein LiPW39_591 [Parcubacteria group bacterium LiPW_39]|nr:MAG: hypothetical protein LiPW39_591 [Parcubacteria group bacterium LiPW_39]
MKKTGISCVIFDFGRVIGNFDHTITCRKLAEFSPFSAEEIHLKIFKSGIEKGYDEGEKFDNFYRQVVGAINAEGLLPEDFFEIWGDIFSENPGIEKIMGQIRPKVKVLLLSNTNEAHWNFISRLPAIKKYFSQPEQLILSFKLGFRKPDSRIFKKGIKRCGCRPHNIVYIDDIQEYVGAFQSLGGKGIVYDCTKMPLDYLEAELSKLGTL